MGSILKSVLVTGCFNVLHPGHLRLLRFAKECGQRLIVAVESDAYSGEAAHVQQALRLEGVKSISWVDEAFIFDEPLHMLVSRIKPNIVVKGKEHELRFNPELAALKKHGGSLIFSSGETIFSSLDLIKKEFQVFDAGSIVLPHKYMARHGIDIENLTAILTNFSKLKVCVVGDLIIDEYITCEPLGMSQEDPTIVVTPIDSTRFIGGAGIVAAHAAGLGADVKFISIAGKDDAHDFALKILDDIGVQAQLFIDQGRPTTLKQRYRSKGKSLLRVSHLYQGAISVDIQLEFFNHVESVLDSVDLLVFSDFNYGALPQPLVEKIVAAAISRGVVCAADSQSSSQVGDIGRFNCMDLITPTEREARISTRNREDGLVVLAEELRKRAMPKNIILKLGQEGLLVHAAPSKDDAWQTDRVDALNSSPKDVAGAGDSLLITSAMTLACGGSIWEAACLGSVAAGIQVGRVGNKPLLTKELLKELS